MGLIQRLSQVGTNLYGALPSAIKWIPLLVLATILVWGGFKAGEYQTTRQYQPIVSEYQSDLEHAETTRIQNTRLKKVVRELSGDIHDLLAENNSKPKHIREVITVETQIPAETRVIETKTLPDDHRFKMESGLVVAEIQSGDETYRLITHDWNVDLKQVVGQKNTTASLKIATSYEPEAYHEIPIDNLRVQRLNPDHEFLEPHVGLGITGSLPVPQVSGSLVMTLLHPGPSWDLLGLRVGANSTQVELGIIPLSYNLGADLPVLTDLWLGPDVSINSSGQPQAGVSLYTKF